MNRFKRDVLVALIAKTKEYTILYEHDLKSLSKDQDRDNSKEDSIGYLRALEEVKTELQSHIDQGVLNE